MRLCHSEGKQTGTPRVHYKYLFASLLSFPVAYLLSYEVMAWIRSGVLGRMETLDTILQHLQVLILMLVLTFSMLSVYRIFSNRLTKRNMLHIDSVLLSIYTSFALARQLTPHQSKSMLLVAIFILSIIAIDKTLLLGAEKRIWLAALGLGILFSLFTCVGRELSLYQALEQCFLTPFFAMQFVLQIIGTAIIYTTLLLFILQYCIYHCFYSGATLSTSPSGFKDVSLIALLIFICWLPYYIVYWPGLISGDGMVEISSMHYMTELSNHHPMIHQLLIKVFLMLGDAFGSINIGIGFFTLFQMLAMAFIFSLSVHYLKKLGLKSIFLWLLIAYYGLLMTNAAYSFTVWKDIPFAGSALLLTIVLYQEVFASADEDSASAKKQKRARTISLVLLGVCFCILRNNGFYAYLLALPFLLLMNKAIWKRLAIIGISVVLLVFSYQCLIYNVLNVEKSKTGEALSIPLQQIARTVRDHGNEITPEEYAVLDEIFVDTHALKDIYIPTISDRVKSEGDSFRSDVFNQNPSRYIKLWLQLGLRFTKTYISAFLCQNFGYWYPDERYWIANSIIDPNNLGIESNPRFADARALVHMIYAEQINIPLLSMLYSIGLMVWLLIIAIVLLCLKKQYRLISPILPLLGILLTSMASPVHCEYRYVYGVIISTPFCFGIALTAKNTALRPQK